MSRQLIDNAKILASAITKWVGNRQMSWKEECILRYTLAHLEGYQPVENRDVDEIVTYGLNPYHAQQQPFQMPHQVHQLPGGTPHQQAPIVQPVKSGGPNYTLILCAAGFFAVGAAKYVFQLF